MRSGARSGNSNKWVGYEYLGFLWGVNGNVGLKRGTSFTQLSVYGRSGFRSSGNILHGNGANLGFRL